MRRVLFERLSQNMFSISRRVSPQGTLPLFFEDDVCHAESPPRETLAEYVLNFEESLPQGTLPLFFEDDAYRAVVMKPK